ncbi:MAG: nicotinate (nicotinamide) nucleotide adenylyltransferase [Fimbriimonas ginsengisoli]|uniref:Probable nicotinate-nucleotide adenylyltransferase n=1 Tax=Fimbriimonas ginsengisoli TaxID=1005039 RepID=A0A931LVL8_FIMGI|nr:nicotinate (nicotinamide) nucleotide adenylyltransferase [Fimbriimonas ginsengisoli]MBI3721155.1 nicotinate (nicotinamide) nucleotide adenylyltransferase [Fimbriimonas ginsengisoli]
MRIGILGGSFDPPHNGHLALARAALEHLALDEVLFVPVARNPLKRFRPSKASHRLEMVRLMIEGEPQMAVSDLEIRRGGKSYAVDSLIELNMARPADYWFLLGADALKDFASWKQPERLLHLCRIAVALRPGQELEPVLRAVPAELRSMVDLVPMPPLDISSTDLRDKLSSGKAIARWVPAQVAAYISENHLYGS